MKTRHLRLAAAAAALALGAACLLIGCGKAAQPLPTEEERLGLDVLQRFSKGALATGATQGSTVYDHYLVVCSAGGVCDIYDLAGETPDEPIADFKLASYNDGTPEKAYQNHANQIMFGASRWAKDDPFPLLYVTSGNSGQTDEEGYVAKCEVERIVYDEATGSWSSQLVQRIAFNDSACPAPFEQGTFTYQDDPASGFVNTAGYQRIGWGWPAWFVDAAPTPDTQGRVFLFSARFRTTAAYEVRNQSTYGISNYYDDNAYIITALPLPALPEDEAGFGATVTLTPADIVDQFTTDFDIYFTQGGTLYNGRIYYTFGNGSGSETTQNGLRVFDIHTKSLLARRDLSQTVFGSQEPECCGVYEGELVVVTGSDTAYRLAHVESDWQTDADGSQYTVCCLCGRRLQER